MTKAKIIRNKNIKSLSKKNGGSLTYRAIAKKYKLDVKTVYDIVNKESEELTIWKNIKQRCLNKNNKQYKDYGGRGISICNRWLKFENFYRDMGKRPRGKSIDRIDNNKGYFKENCRWADSKQQSRNRRTNNLITYKGETLCVTAWAEKLKIKRSLLQNRLYRGWSVEKAFK